MTEPAASVASTAAGSDRAGGAGRRARRRGRGTGVAGSGARGEGLAALSRTAAARALPVLRGVPLPDRDIGPGAHPGRRRLPARRRGPSRLDGPVRRDARAPGRAACVVPRKCAIGADVDGRASGWPGASAGCCPSGAAASASMPTSRRRQAVIANGAVFVADAGGHRQRSARSPRSAAQRLGDHRHADRRADPADRDGRAPRSCTSADRMASRVLPPTTVRELAGLPSDACCRAGSRDELALAPCSATAWRRLGPVVEALYPGRSTRRTTAAPARPADLAAAPTRPPRPRLTRLRRHS